ncbi:MAG: hypothetical protein ACRD47_13140 [Nitrososphaeraceae archaeon]
MQSHPDCPPPEPEPTPIDCSVGSHPSCPPPDDTGCDPSTQSCLPPPEGSGCNPSDWSCIAKYFGKVPLDGYTCPNGQETCYPPGEYLCPWAPFSVNCKPSEMYRLKTPSEVNDELRVSGCIQSG